MVRRSPLAGAASYWAGSCGGVVANATPQANATMDVATADAIRAFPCFANMSIPFSQKRLSKRLNKAPVAL